MTNPPPFYFHGYAKLPYQRTDGSIKLEFESLQELGNADLAKITAWNKIAADIAILPEGAGERLSGLLGNSAQNESEGSEGAAVDPVAPSSRKGQTPSRKMRFYCNGMLLQIEPDADEARKEEFYRWVIETFALTMLARTAKDIQEQWREITTDD